MIWRPSRRAVLEGAGVCAAAGVIAPAGTMLPSVRNAMAAEKHAPAFLTGVNLAGAEFGSRFPGRHGTDYIYPSSADVAYYRALGFNVLRLPFRWERLQHDLLGPFDDAEWSRLNGLVTIALKAGFHVILDPHNFARRALRSDGFATGHLIGSTRVPTSAFTQFWAELCRRTADQPKIIYGLMNEPYDISAKDWLGIAQPTINRIRAEGARNLILVPGTAYSGAHSWHSAGNTVLEQLADPAGNMAIEVHQYLDHDSSGRSGHAVSATVGSERIAAFQVWARRRGLKAFLGEFGASSQDVNLAAIRILLSEIARNKDVWLGWAAWAGGPWWPPEFPFRLEPASSGELPAQTRLLAQMAKRG